MSKKVIKIPLLFAVFAVMVPSLPAQGSPADSLNPPSSWTFTASTLSQYTFRGVRRGGESLQPSLEFDTGTLGAGIWGNVPLRNKVAGQSDPELDFYGYYAIALTNATSLIPGFTAYTYPNARRGDGFYAATFEPNIALNHTLGGVRLIPKLYYDFVLKGPTAELTASFAVPLQDWGTEVDFSASAGTFLWKDAVADTNPAVKNWGDYYVAGVSLPYQVSRKSHVLIGWTYSKGSNNYLKRGTAGKTRNAATAGSGAVTLTYSVTF